MADLAIVIPYFKIQFFEKTMASLSNQTDKRFNVYIGDDASPDDPQILRKKYQGKFNFSYHRFEENIGGTSLSKQWERCIGLTQGEPWIMILGDDDWISNNYVELFYTMFLDKRIDSNLLRYSTFQVDLKSGKTSSLCLQPLWEKPTQAFWRKCIHQTRSSLSEYIFKRTVYNKYGFYNYDLAWSSDDRAWLEFSEGKKIYSINDAHAYITISDKSITGQSHNYLRKRKVKILFYKFLLKDYARFYTNNQINLLSGRLENEILASRKLNLNEVFFLSIIFIKHSNTSQKVKFLKKILRSYIFNE